MSQFAEDVYLGADLVEIPCEFCFQLYPFQLLMEHQSGCRPDLLHFNLDDVAPSAQVANTSSKTPIIPKLTEAKQKSPDVSKPAVPSPILKATDISAGTRDKNSNVDPFGALLRDDDDDEIPIFEDHSQENGVKLMSYGSSIVKRTEEEKPSFKPPPLPIFNDQNDTKDISNIISDDDEGGESLEDFWRRADIKNTQRLRKLKK